MLDVLYLFVTQDGHVMAKLADGQIVCVDGDLETLSPKREVASMPEPAMTVAALPLAA